MDFGKIIGKFDFNFYKFKCLHLAKYLSFKRLFNKLLSIYIFLTIIKNIIILTTISDENNILLTEIGDLGSILAGSKIKIIINSGYIYFSILVFILRVYYQMTENQWILKINEIYEQIKTQSMDRIISKRAKFIIKHIVG